MPILRTTSRTAASATNRLYCDGIQKQFMWALAKHYYKIDPTADKLDVQKKVRDWLRYGTPSTYIDKLFTVDTKKNFPIWWAGFYVEDPDGKTNPVENMKQAATIVNGYSSLNVPLSNEFKSQTKFWKACSKIKAFTWGDYLSRSYTYIALRHNPKHIGLFLNKNTTAFVTSFFFKTELKLINEHYKKLGEPVQMHIFNLQDNCQEIKDIIDETLQSINNDKKSYITIICQLCKPAQDSTGNITLSSCVQQRSTRTNNGVLINRNMNRNTNKKTTTNNNSLTMTTTMNSIGGRRTRKR